MILDDSYITEYFSTVRYKINPILLKEYKNKNGKRYKEYIWKYVNDRFEDSMSWLESLCRIILKIEERPRCKECGKELEFKYNLGYKCFKEYCSYHCQMIHLNKIGKMNSKEAVNKQAEKRKKTLTDKYGVDNPFKKKEVRERIKQTFLDKYGVDNPFKKKELFDYRRQYQHQLETKRKNNTFNTSKLEEELYLYIKEKFPGVKRQYKDEKRYPFLCDFYIPSLDCFIELQGHWTHGNHPYNNNSIKDQKKVEEWKSKHTRYYDNAIHTWTISDVIKREYAKKSNISYKEIWTLDEGKEFIDKLNNYYSVPILIM